MPTDQNTHERILTHADVQKQSSHTVTQIHTYSHQHTYTHHISTHIPPHQSPPPHPCHPPPHTLPHTHTHPNCTISPKHTSSPSPSSSVFPTLGFTIFGEIFAYLTVGFWVFLKSNHRGNHIPSLWMVHVGRGFVSNIHLSRTWMSGSWVCAM